MNNLLGFIFVHCIVYQTFFIFTNALNVYSYRVVADNTNDCLATMAEIEMNFGKTDKHGFAMFTIFKDGLLRNAIFLP